jgi:hypothetical protein
LKLKTLILILVLVLTGCNQSSYAEEKYVLQKIGIAGDERSLNVDVIVVRDKDTGCEYFLGTFYAGFMNPRMNADGTQKCEAPKQ